MRIAELKKSERKKGRLLVKLEDGDILRVTEEELLRFRLREGMDLDGETLEALRGMEMEEVSWFLERFAEAFGLTLDGLQRG